jgi:sulfoacetaldehyde acetyltransferase
MATETTKQRMTPSEAFVETLVANGVRDVFGIVGSAYMDAHDLFPLAGIRFISVAHEQNAAHMADGYARATGRHGVCIGQNGPGITNFVTAIAAAYWAHSPVVAITPEAEQSDLGSRRFSGNRAVADLLEDHALAGPGQQSAAHRRADRACLPLRAA